jgi:DNA repair exonuclease SbcCD ATPase subunit
MVRAADSAIAGFESAVSASVAADSPIDFSKASQLQNRVAETARKVQKLRSRLAELPRLGRTANEIARKSNLIALNTEIQSEDNPSSASFGLLTSEVNSLSQRAEALGKEIRTLSESLSSEVSDLATGFAEISSGTGEAARGLEQTIQTLREYENRGRDLSELRPKLTEFNTEHSAESQKITGLVQAISSDRSDETQIREAEIQLQKLMTLVENLHDSISDLSISGVRSLAPDRNDVVNPTPTFEKKGTESMEFVGEN